ncbi:DUF5667 domain-containing protein [Terrabacter sp. Root181]|uniref:DUF5667 domain-containing protein n=1 Tax=Terrabacter sp. Root181 TaxID=1736484 RepID=UPI0006F8D05C|nr:DUF5667 domain-containing protein [Terrabacter sp. Root181]KRB43709.1 hypothetical protein ASD90_18915 [Terrabacter sp. Root181]
MDLGANADGELLQRALDGEQVSEPGILELVAVLHAVQSVDQAGLAPRAEFVSDLRARLLADDATAVVPAVPLVPLDGEAGGPTDPTPSADERATEGDGRDAGGTVSVLRVAAGPLKFIAAAAASILVIGGALGFASRSAVPGDALYGVKELLDRAAVQLAGSRYDEGLTYLDQAQEHIADARDLIDRGAPSTHDLDTAYDAATDATGRAQTILMEVYRTEQRADALTELADFYTRAIPQVDAMRPRVPAGSLASWQRLRDLLGAGQVATLKELAACGVCGDRSAQARQILARLPGAVRPSSPVSGTSAPGSTPAGPGATTGRPAGSAPRPPVVSATLAGGLPAPGVTVTGGVTLPGGTINLPGVRATSSSVGVGGGGVTLPGATVSLPGVGITSSTIGVGGGGVTVPGATVPLPSVTLGVPTVPLPLPTKILP